MSERATILQHDHCGIMSSWIVVAQGASDERRKSSSLSLSSLINHPLLSSPNRIAILVDHGQPPDLDFEHDVSAFLYRHVLVHRDGWTGHVLRDLVLQRAWPDLAPNLDDIL